MIALGGSPVVGLFDHHHHGQAMNRDAGDKQITLPPEVRSLYILCIHVSKMNDLRFYFIYL